MIWTFSAQAQSMPPLTMMLLDVSYRMSEGLFVTLSIKEIWKRLLKLADKSV